MHAARKPVQVGDQAELRTLDGHRLVWEKASIVVVEDDFIVFQTAAGQRPAYGYEDEGTAWRRGTWVGCPVCKGTGQVQAPTTENT